MGALWRRTRHARRTAAKEGDRQRGCWFVRGVAVCVLFIRAIVAVLWSAIEQTAAGFLDCCTSWAAVAKGTVGVW